MNWLVADLLAHAAWCRRQAVGWTWPGSWTAQDWKDSARQYIKMARDIRLIS